MKVASQKNFWTTSFFNPIVNDMKRAQKGSKYITKRRFCWIFYLNLEWSYILLIAVILFLFRVDMSTLWLSSDRKPVKNLHSPHYYMAMRNCQVITKWFMSGWRSVMFNAVKCRIFKVRVASWPVSCLMHLLFAIDFSIRLMSQPAVFYLWNINSFHIHNTGFNWWI